MNSTLVKQAVESHPGVKKFNLSATQLMNEFSHGFVSFDHEISITEKLEVMDTLSKLFSGEIVGVRKGTYLFVYNEAKFSRVSVTREEPFVAWQFIRK